MRLVGRVKFVDDPLGAEKFADDLTACGIIVEQVRNAVIAELPRISPVGAEIKVYRIPAELEKAEIRLEIEEEKGFGYVCVVALPSGKTARAWRITDGLAHFAFSGDCISVEARRVDGKVFVRILRHGPRRRDETAWIHSELVAEGEWATFPRELDHFYSAALAAVAKLDCRDCRHAHYADGGRA